MARAILLSIPLILLIVRVIALVQIARSKAAGATLALWVLIITIFPLVRPLLWFAVGRHTATSGGSPGPF